MVRRRGRSPLMRESSLHRLLPPGEYLSAQMMDGSTFSISTQAPSFGSSTPAHRFPPHLQSAGAASSLAHRMAGSIASVEDSSANEKSGGKPAFLTLSLSIICSLSIWRVFQAGLLQGLGKALRSGRWACPRCLGLHHN